MANISELVGKTITKITGGQGDDRITFECEGDETFAMYHSQDCCESVSVEDIVGDINDLIGSPILQAEESTSDQRPEDLPEPQWADDSQTWTFYRLQTIKGGVTIRWYGSSNGFYSESVDFERV